MTQIEIFLLCALVLLSFIDLKFKTLPSFLTTTIIFVLAIVKINNINFGLFALLFGLIMLELEYFSGLGDLKATIMLGFMTSSIGNFFIMIILVTFVGVIYKIISKKLLKIKDEVAFIPVFAITYIIMLLTNIT